MGRESRVKKERQCKTCKQDLAAMDTTTLLAHSLECQEMRHANAQRHEDHGTKSHTSSGSIESRADHPSEEGVVSGVV